MTVIERISSLPTLSAEYAAWPHDAITLTWEERRQGHGRRRSDAGLEFAISLPSGVVLKAGDCFVLTAEKTVVAVREAEERVYVVRPKRPQDWAFYAYHVGNRHQSVMIGETELVFLESPAVRSLLDQLHAEYTSDSRPFTAALVGHSH
jgi:urease accessory protein